MGKSQLVRALGHYAAERFPFPNGVHEMSMSKSFTDGKTMAKHVIQVQPALAASCGLAFVLWVPGFAGWLPFPFRLLLFI